MADKIAIAVAGMHGKSTVSAMLATLLTEMDEDPTVLVGADVKSIGANAKLGKSDLMVVEACEYKRAFLDFEPTIAVLTNIEEEHLDIYKDLADIIETFGMFVAKLPKDGLLAAYIDDLNVRKVLGRTKACVVGYGFGRKPEEFKGVYWHIKNVEQNGHHKKFAIDVEGEDIGVFEIKLPGNFNILNVVATLIVADFLCLDMEKAGQVLANFAGAGRRFEILGEKDGVLVIDDYGHHPTEIKNVLAAIKEFYPSNDLWVVFQAHQYSRTHHLLADFATSFGNAQKLILIDIYRVRDSEEDVKKVNADILGERISAESKVGVVRVADYQEAADYLQKNCKKGIIVLTLGAGPVNKVASLFLNK